MSFGREEIFEDEGGADTTEKIAIIHAKEPENDHIVRSSLRPDQAFEFFNGKLFVDSGEVYSTADSIEIRVESPMQRFARLKSELSQLSQDLDAVEKTDSGTESNVWASLQREARGLISQCSSLEKHPAWEIEQRKQAPVAAGLDSIIHQFDSLSTSPTPNLSVPFSESASSLVAPPSLLNHIINIDQRLSTVEAAVGSSHLSKGAPLAQSILRLENRVQAMDAAAVDKLKQSLTALRAELDSSHATPSAQQLLQVSAVHEELKQVHTAVDDMPAVVLRLQTLQSLHLAASGTVQRMEALEKCVAEVSSEVSANSKLISTLSQSIQENLSTIQSSMAAFEVRLSSGQRS